MQVPFISFRVSHLERLLFWSSPFNCWFLLLVCPVTALRLVTGPAIATGAVVMVYLSGVVEISFFSIFFFFFFFLRTSKVFLTRKEFNSWENSWTSRMEFHMHFRLQICSEIPTRKKTFWFVWSFHGVCSLYHGFRTCCTPVVCTYISSPLSKCCVHWSYS